MAMKLDRSLDEILSSNKGSARGGRGGRTSRTTRNGARPANRPNTTAPAAGVQKSTTRQVSGRGRKTTPTGPSAPGGGGYSKIHITSLPKDIVEQTLKDYIIQALPGHRIQRIEVAYGPNGVSRGSATVVFYNTHSAAAAVKAFNGLLVDNRPMKVEVIIDSETAKILAPKSLSERVAQPKSNPRTQPKSAAAVKTPAAGAVRGAKKTRGRGGAKNARPTKKTAEELDSEMADYWESGANAGTETAIDATNGTAQATTNGDASMDDDIL